MDVLRSRSPGSHRPERGPPAPAPEGGEEPAVGVPNAGLGKQQTTGLGALCRPVRLPVALAACPRAVRTLRLSVPRRTAADTRAAKLGRKHRAHRAATAASGARARRSSGGPSGSRGSSGEF